MKLTLFSVDEANRVAREVGPALKQLVGTKQQLDRTLSRLEVLQIALAGADEGNPDRVEMEQLLSMRERLGESIRQGIQAIQRHGCLVKDLDRGLLDFYAVSGDRLIFLCWQLGETRVSHWHTLEGGFAARQPLNASDPD